MPYVSAKQRAFMHIHHPEIAKKWDAKYGGKVSHRAAARRRADGIRKNKQTVVREKAE